MRSRSKNLLGHYLGRPSGPRRTRTVLVVDTAIEQAFQQLDVQLDWSKLPEVVERRLAGLYPMRTHGPVRSTPTLTAYVFGHLDPAGTENNDAAYLARRQPWLDYFRDAGYGTHRCLADSREAQLDRMRAYIEQQIEDRKSTASGEVRRLAILTTASWELSDVLARAKEAGWQIVIFGSHTNRDFWQRCEGVEFIFADDLPQQFIQLMVCPVPLAPVAMAA